MLYHYIFITTSTLSILLLMVLLLIVLRVYLLIALVGCSHWQRMRSRLRSSPGQKKPRAT